MEEGFSNSAILTSEAKSFFVGRAVLSIAECLAAILVFPLWMPVATPRTPKILQLKMFPILSNAPPPGAGGGGEAKTPS